MQETGKFWGDGKKMSVRGKAMLWVEHYTVEGRDMNALGNENKEVYLEGKQGGIL